MSKDPFQSRAKDIASAIDNVIPNKVKKAMNPLAQAENFANIDIKYISKNINIFKKTLVQIHKALNPYMIKTIEVAYHYKNYFEKENYNHFLLKQSILEMWNSLENELISNNGCNPKSDFLAIFEKYAKETNYILRKGCVLFRARKININNLSQKIIAIINNAIEQYHDFNYQKLSEKEKDIWNYIKTVSQEEWEQDYIDKFNLQDNVFWGYDVNGSDAPPPEQSQIQGRANLEGIRYLYTACDLKTAISEIQPSIQQIVSVAKIKILKKLKIFNFDFNEAYSKSELFKQPLFELEEQLGISFWQLQIFFDTISELFSQPTFGDIEKYIVSQYLSEHIRKLGFDGIKYKSALKKGGSNIVLFDTSRDENNKPKNYLIVKSSLHRIENVKITPSILLPRK